jgi:hypothetical protein
MNNPLLIFVVIVAFILIFLCLWPHNKSENFGQVLGALAPYREQIGECIAECDREDPSRRLLAPGNWNCGTYCESVFTKLAEKGVDPKLIKIKNSFTTCEKQCENAPSENSRRKCISMCFGQNEVAKWCKELWCPYTDIDNSECMRDCVRINTTNNNQLAWTWMAHG